MKGKIGLVVAAAAILSLLLAIPSGAGAKVKINVGSTFGPGAPVYKGQEKFKEDQTAHDSAVGRLVYGRRAGPG